MTQSSSIQYPENNLLLVFMGRTVPGSGPKGWADILVGNCSISWADGENNLLTHCPLRHFSWQLPGITIFLLPLLVPKNRTEMEEVRSRQEFVYRVSTAAEWEELQKSGGTLGGDLDRRTGCIHLSDLRQVKMVLTNYFKGREDLYLLQIDTGKLGEGLVYETVDDSNYFPHFYGSARSFNPLLLDFVVKVEKLEVRNNDFSCSLLNQLGS